MGGDSGSLLWSRKMNFSRETERKFTPELLTYFDHGYAPNFAKIHRSRENDADTDVELHTSQTHRCFR